MATRRNITIRIFHSLRHRDYALFWCTDMLGSIGQFVEEVALYWITYEITGSAMALGVLGLCSATPRLILGAFSGVLVDRYDRKLLLILVQFGCAHPDINFPGDLYTSGLSRSGTCLCWKFCSARFARSILRLRNRSSGNWCRGKIS